MAGSGVIGMAGRRPWTMVAEIARFEVRYQLRQPLFPIAALAFLALGIAAVSSDLGPKLSEAPAAVARNAPFVIGALMASFSIFGLFVVAAFVAAAALRDFDHDCHMLFFSRPIGRFDYFGGRFLGALTVSTGLFGILTAGLMLGQLAPWQDPERLGPIVWWPFVYGLLVFALPNLVVMAALFFAIAIWSRRMLWTYLAVIVFVTLQDAVEVVSQQEGTRAIGALIEPLGLTAQKFVARYWTVDEYRRSTPALWGHIALNRAAWLAIAGGFLALAWWRFKVACAAGPGGSRARSQRSTVSPDREARVLRSVSAQLRKPPLVETGARAALFAFWSQCRFEISWTLRGPFFVVCTMLAVILVVSIAWIRSLGDGDPILPYTSVLVSSMSKTLAPFLAVMVVFYAGELTWRDRALGTAGILDATPTARASALISRFVAIGAAVLGVLCAATFATILLQQTRQAVPIEPLLYLQTAAVIAWPAMLLAAPCLLVQAIAGQKFLGYLIVIGLFTLRMALPAVGWDSPLYLYGTHPPVSHSDMSGYGPTASPFVWFSLHWTAVAILMLWAAARIWPRGAPVDLRTRIQRLWTIRSSRLGVAVAVLAVLLSVTSFVVVYYNARVRNEGLGPETLRERRAEYERRYSEYASLPLPRITSIYSEIDLDPIARRVAVRGRYLLLNDGTEPITTLPFTVPSRWEEDIFRMDEGVRLVGMDLPAHRTLVDDHELGFHAYELLDPLAANDVIEVSFEVLVENEGFTDRRPNLQILENGTFFTQRTVFPCVGYTASKQLVLPRDRREHGLDEGRRTPAIDDPIATSWSYVDADWVECETIFSTALDQTALAGGVLVREWEADGRRFFHYRSTAKTQGLLGFGSARYLVKRDRIGDVDLEIYYHPNHGVNVDRMMEIMKSSVDRFSTWFGPYPHRVLRIAEMPSTNGQLAVSFASFIGFSEAFGFLSDVREGHLDTLAWITAHEVAHQWWGHQLAPAECQGSTMLGESLAEYSALLLLEELFGREEIVRFRGRELDRYLVGRGREEREELPLALVENQAYVHYSKGALAFTALADQVGKGALIGVLRAFLEDHRFIGPPYARSTELIDRLRSLAPAERRSFLEDLFQRIVLYDLRVEEAFASERKGGGFTVSAALRIGKFSADGQGRETEESSLGTPVTVEIVGERGVLWKETRALGDETLRVEVDELPTEVRIDPDGLLIDRVRTDNRVAVRLRERTAVVR